MSLTSNILYRHNRRDLYIICANAFSMSIDDLNQSCINNALYIETLPIPYEYKINNTAVTLLLLSAISYQQYMLFMQTENNQQKRETLRDISEIRAIFGYTKHWIYMLKRVISRYDFNYEDDRERIYSYIHGIFNQSGLDSILHSNPLGIIVKLLTAERNNPYFNMFNICVNRRICMTDRAIRDGSLFYDIINNIDLYVNDQELVPVVGTLSINVDIQLSDTEQRNEDNEDNEDNENDIMDNVDPLWD